MAILPPSVGPHFAHSVHDQLSAISDKQLAGVSLLLSKIFSGRMALSTVYDGPRQTSLRAEDTADLKDLEAALPDGTISHDPLRRDRFGAEPRMLAYLRQAEGHPPQAQALLVPTDEHAADEAVAEARAMGYVLVPGGRTIALEPPGEVEILNRQTGRVALSAGGNWKTLQQAALTADLCAFEPIHAVYESPLAAARAGILGQVREIRRFGLPWRLEITLPPLIRAATQYLFIFPDAEPAALAHQRITRELLPLYAATFPALEPQILSAARLSARHKWLERPGAQGLRLILDGPHSIQQATLRLADRLVRAHGGQRFWKVGLPTRAVLDALLAACGACRLERPEGSQVPTPEDASIFPIVSSIRGRVEHLEIVFYLRDLARSLGEAQQSLGLIEDGPCPAAPDLLDGPDETVRAHG